MRLKAGPNGWIIDGRKGGIMSHRRRNSLRLKGYDYTRPGGYFVTLRTYKGRPSLSRVDGGKVYLSRAGESAFYYWLKLPDYFDHIRLDQIMIMPNHIHAIIIFLGSPKNAGKPTTSKYDNLTPGSLSVIIRTYKSLVTKRINTIFNTDGKRFWQRNYYDHIIRDPKSLNRIRAYIRSNPYRV